MGTLKKIGWKLKKYGFMSLSVSVECETQTQTQHSKKIGFQCMTNTGFTQNVSPPIPDYPPYLCGQTQTQKVFVFNYNNFLKGIFSKKSIYI